MASDKADPTERLFHAAEEGRVDELRELLAGATTVDVRGEHGHTLLMAAAGEGQLSCVNLLLEAGADANATDHVDQWTALIYAARKANNCDVLKLLLGSGAVVNFLDAEGNSALREAAINGFDRNVEELLRASADPNLANKIGETPLSAASCEGHEAVVRLLIEAGANPNMADHQGATAIMWAFSSPAYHSIVRLLIDAGADPDGVDLEGYTVLMHALSKNDVDIIKLIAGQAVDINHKNIEGESVLSLARRHNSPGVVQALLSYGASG